MIIVNLKGGLGNQMFQYALGRRLALKHNTELKLDTTSLSRAEEIGNIYRPFALDAFSIVKNIATEEEIQRLRYPYGLVSKLTDTFKRKILRRGYVVFDEAVLELPNNTYLDGYWQSPLYFENIRETLLKDFTLREPLASIGEEKRNAILQSNAVALHVRRGDYVANPRVFKENGLCSVEYYNRAISYITKAVENPTFYIFSDDPTWVRDNITLPEGSVFISDTHLKPEHELYLMSICKHTIIANSSFSWWAAWLNQNPNKIVIAPTPWFDTITYDQNLIPESWIQLPKT